MTLRDPTMAAFPAPPRTFHLRWSNHLQNLGTVFGALRDSEGLADVTLACQDGSVKVHKVMLATCSNYFLVRREFYSIACLQLLHCTICSVAIYVHTRRKL